MSKELEALKTLVDNLDQARLKELSSNDDYWMKYEEVSDAIQYIEKALTPPTADEVCKALSKWVDENDNITYPNEIYYDENRKTFYTYNYLDEWTPIVENGKLLYVMIDLPINIHKMVISFYEGEVK